VLYSGLALTSNFYCHLHSVLHSTTIREKFQKDNNWRDPQIEQVDWVAYHVAYIALP